jgi:molecular chaperone GrpE
MMRFDDTAPGTGSARPREAAGPVSDLGARAGEAPGGTENLVQMAAVGQSSEAPGAAGAGVTVAGTDVETLTRQRDEYYDLLLRKTAEFDNYRRRVERERRELADYTTGELAKELLPIIDDFERALAAERGSSSVDALEQGVELIHRRFLEFLGKRGIVAVTPLGEDFDPHQHEAVMRVPAEGHRDGEIVEVYSPGYKLGDRLLRPAMVKVATA